MDEKELENLRIAVQNLTSELQVLSGAVGTGREKMRDTFDSSKASSTGMADAMKKAQQANNDFKASVDNAKNSLKAWSKDIHGAASEVEGGFSKYSAGMNAAGKAVGAVAAQFGPLGKALDYAIRGFTMAAEAVAKQNDNIFKSYNELGKFGATARLSTDEVLNLGIKAGYSSKNLESLYKSAKSLDTGLVQLGGSASGGIKAFAEIANVGEQARNNFRALGYSQEEVTEMQANYVKQLGSTGGLLAKTPRQLSEESQKYIYNLTALAEITGKSVKEQQKAQEVAVQQRNVNAYLGNLEQKRVDALANGNKAEAERLEKQISSTKAYAAHIVATEDAETAAAKLESISTDGAVVMTKNNATLAGMGYNFDKVNEALRRGESPMKMYFVNAEENNKVQKQAKEMFGENLYRLGETSVGLQKFAGQSNEARAAQAAYNKYLTLSEEEKQKIDKMTAEDAIKALTAEKSKDDARLNAEQKRQEAEMQYRQAMDELTNLVSKAINPALGLMADVLKIVAKGLKGFVGIIYAIGDKFDDLKDFFEEMMMGFRDNLVFRKMFGLEKTTDAERQAFAERKASRQAGIREREERLSGVAAPAEATGGGGTTAQAQSLSTAPSMASTAPSGQPPSQNVKANLASVSAALKKQGITDPNYIKAVLGNVMKESGGVAKNENMDYSKTSNDRIRSIFGKRASGKSDEELNKIKSNPEMMAEMMYGKDTDIGRGMGNTEPGDGWKYRGRGYIGITGKALYAKASKELFGDDRLVKNPDLVNDPEVAAPITAWYMGRSKQSMQGKMGFGSGDLSVEQANMLATSQVAGRDVRGSSDYIKGELLGKVTKYAAGMGPDVLQGQGGGFFSGPATGYPVTLHGNEVVIPDFKISDFNKAITAASKTELQTSSTMPMAGSSDSMSDIMSQLMGMMESKMNDLISAVESGNDTSDKILQYSRV